MDIVTIKERSALMSRIRAKDTKPELIVRRLAHALGYRFRLHRRDLAGVPDLTFPARKKVLFVHGCFWHQHRGCKFAYRPKANAKFWKRKFAANRRRDTAVLKKLKRDGWGTLIIWECETSGLDALKSRLTAYLEFAAPDSER